MGRPKPVAQASAGRQEVSEVADAGEGTVKREGGREGEENGSQAGIYGISWAAPKSGWGASWQTKCGAARVRVAKSASVGPTTACGRVNGRPSPTSSTPTWALSCGRQPAGGRTGRYPAAPSATTRYFAQCAGLRLPAVGRTLHYSTNTPAGRMILDELFHGSSQADSHALVAFALSFALSRQAGRCLNANHSRDRVGLPEGHRRHLRVPILLRACLATGFFWSLEANIPACLARHVFALISILRLQVITLYLATCLPSRSPSKVATAGDSSRSAANSQLPWPNTLPLPRSRAQDVSQLELESTQSSQSARDSAASSACP